MSPPTTYTPKEAGLKEALLVFFMGQIASSLYGKIAKRIKLYVIKYQQNQWLMTWIAGHDKDPSIRILATKRIVRPKALRGLLVKEKHRKVREAIISRMPPKFQIVEYKVAKTKRLKQEVMEQIVSQDALAKCLLTERDPTLALTILPRLSKVTLIKQMKTHSLKEVRDWVTAREKTIEERSLMIGKNPHTLYKAILAIKEKNEHLLHLLSWVTTPSIWYMIAREHPDQEVKSIAVGNLETRQDLLVKVIVDTKQTNTLRTQALSMINNPTILRGLVNSLEMPIKSHAVAKLNPNSDAQLIKKILETETDEDTLTAAILVCKSADDLANLVVRAEAVDKLRGVRTLAMKQLLKVQP